MITLHSKDGNKLPFNSYIATDKQVEKAISDKFKAGQFKVLSAETQAKIDNLAKLKDGSTSGDAELQDIRIGADGVVYENAGEAVRQQLRKVEMEYNKFFKSFFISQRTGKKYTCRKPLYSISPTPVWEKIDDNEGLACVPSTLVFRGQNDYENIPLFKPYNCNWEIDNAGNKIITAIEGDGNYRKDGMNGQVGVLNMPWYVKIWSDDKYDYVSISDTEHEGYELFINSYDKDGNNQGFMVHSKYNMVDINGKPYSASGYKPCGGDQLDKDISYNGMINYCRKHNNYYCGEAAADIMFLQLQVILKYGSSVSQTKVGGCSDYSFQYNLADMVNNQKYFIITTSQASNFRIGSTVSIGTCAKNTDRYYSDVHDIVYCKRITKIEAIEGTSNSKVYLESDTGFTTNTTMKVTTMPWYTGFTDNVLGIDGNASMTNSVERKTPAIIGGIETAIGGYEVLGNAIMDVVIDSDRNVFREFYISHDATKISNNLTNIKRDYNKSIYRTPGNSATWKYISVMKYDLENGIGIPVELEANSYKGYCDSQYSDVGTSGQRECLMVGNLLYGSSAGLWLLSAHYRLGSRDWHILSRVSPNGNCKKIK